MLKSESYKRGAVVSTGLNILVKSALFLNTIIIAYYFGTGIDTDLYFYIFTTVTLIAGLANGMDLAVIIPEGMHVRVDHGLEEAIGFYNFFGLGYIIIGVVLTAIFLFLGIPLYTAVSSFSNTELNNHSSLLMLSSLLPVLMITTSYLTSVLTTLKYFTAPLIASGIVQICALVSLVLFHNQFGVSALFGGMIVGYILNLVILLCFMYFKLDWHFRFSTKHVTKRVKKNLGSVQMGNMATFAFNYGIITVLSSLPTGIYSAYNYSMQVLNIPNNFFVSQVAAVAGIKLNELSAKGLWADMNKVFSETINILLFVIVPFCFITFLYSHVIVNFLFLRGDFTSDSAEKVSFFLRYLIFLSPCLAINTFISRLMTAGKKVSHAFYFQLGFNLSMLILILLFTKFYKESGFVITMLSSYYFYICVVCIFLFKWLMPFIAYKNVIKSMVLIFLYNLPFLWIFYKIFGESQPIPILVMIAMLYYAAVLGFNYFIKISRPTDLYIVRTINLVRLKIRS